MVEITVINELAFPTSSIRRRKDISMAAHNAVVLEWWIDRAGPPRLYDRGAHSLKQLLL